MLRTPRAASKPPRKQPSPPAAAYVTAVALPPPWSRSAPAPDTRKDALNPATGTIAPVS
jgi:hypothetical protein